MDAQSLCKRKGVLGQLICSPISAYQPYKFTTLISIVKALSSPAVGILFNFAQYSESQISLLSETAPPFLLFTAHAGGQSNGRLKVSTPSSPEPGNMLASMAEETFQK